MTTRRHTRNDWKREQIDCFKEYLRLFDTDSREYHMLMEKIEQLERAL